MPLPVYDTKDAVPAADAADFVEHKGKWHQKDWVAAVVEADRVKGINATLITEKGTAETTAATERARADAAEAAAKTGKTKEELDAYAATLTKPLETERDTLKTSNVTLRQQLDRIELEKLVRKHREDAGLHPDRIEDPDNMEVLLKSTRYENGKAVVLDAEGKPTATPFVDHLKRFSESGSSELKKKFLYAFPGGSGGGAEHGESGTSAASAATAAKALEQVNAQNAARPNPLAPKVAAKV